VLAGTASVLFSACYGHVMCCSLHSTGSQCHAVCETVQDLSMTSAAIEAEVQSMSKEKVMAAAREGQSYLKSLNDRGALFK
jgi:hypothetical protein